MKEFLIRTASGLTYAVLMIGSVTIHPLLFLAIFLFILVKGMVEFYSLVKLKEHQPMVIPGISTGVLLFLAAFFQVYMGMAVWVYYIPAFAVFLLFAIPMFKQEVHPFYSLATTLTAILYVAVPVTLFTGLVFHPYKEGFDYQVALFLFACIWLNDTGAYISGKLLGKHKMFPRVSPNKSWEGLLGGLTLALVTSQLIQPLLPDMPHRLLWLFTLIIVAAGTLGDFAESAWKRAAGVKDSGRLMPGHGGLLDRFDSLLFAVPILYLLIRILPF